MPVGHARHHSPELDAVGATGGVSQCAPSLQHLLLWRTYPGDLEKVIWNPQTVKTRALGLPHYQPKGAAKKLRIRCPGNIRDQYSYAHTSLLLVFFVLLLTSSSPLSLV